MAAPLNNRSLERLGGVHPDIRAVAVRAIEISGTNFQIPQYGGYRTEAEQRKLVERGTSKTMASNHRKGLAVDVLPYIDGIDAWTYDRRHGEGASKPAFRAVNGAMMDAARELGVPLQWGFTLWGWDMPHHQLDPRRYADASSPSLINPRVQKMAFVLRADDIAQMVRYRLGQNVKLSPDQVAIIDGIVEHQALLIPYGILEKRFRVMHFLSQAAHETDDFNTLEEYASGWAYEGRHDLGNTEPGDGPRYKGMGIFMATGRANARAIGNRIGFPLEEQPELRKDPRISVLTAGDFWQWRKLSSIADDDEPANVEAVTRKINGGMNGFENRLAYFMAAGRVDWPSVATTPEPDEITLPRALAEQLFERLRGQLDA